jgi:hypothetical protein
MSAGLASSILFNGLNPGDVVFLVVDGFGGLGGPFRLNVTENGLLNAAPSTNSVLNPSNQCDCPGTSDNGQTSIVFPSRSDQMLSGSSSTTVLNTPGDRVTGVHIVPFSRIAGVALEFKLAANGLCSGGYATFDFMMDNRAIAAFTIDNDAPTALTIRMSLQTFDTIALSTTSPAIELRLREVAAACSSGAGLRFDLATSGSLTLLGSP